MEVRESRSRTVSGAVAEKEASTEVDLEHALRIVGIGWYNLKYCALFAGFLIATIVETTGYSFVLPAGKCELGMTDGVRGFVASIPYIAIFLTSHFWGYMADTKGRKPTLTVASFGVGVFGIAAAFMPNLISFAICKFIASLFLASPAAVSYAFIGELLPLRHRDLALSITNSLQITGSAIVPLLAWAILPAGFNADFGAYSFRPWRLLVVANCCPFVILGAFMLFGPESPKYLLAQGKEFESLEVLRTIYAGNTCKSRADLPITKLKVENFKSKEDNQEKSFMSSLSEQTIPLLKPPYLKWLSLNGFLLFGIFMTLNGLYMWVPDVLNRVLSGSAGDGVTACHVIKLRLNESAPTAACDDTIATSTYVINSIANVSCAVLSLFAGVTIKLVGKKALLVAIFWLVGLACVLISVVTQQVAFAVFLAMLPLAGVAIGPVNAYSVAIFPTELRGMAVGLSLMIGRFGSILGTNVAGILINGACEATFYAFGGLLILCGFLSFLLPKSKT